MSKILKAAVFILLSSQVAFAAQGIKGRASLEGVTVDTVEIRIYELRAGGFGPFTGDSPVATTRSGTDGQYSVELKPGRYIVEGIKKKTVGAAKSPGDLYCVYSGSPVTVTEGRWTTTGLYMTVIPPENRTKGKESRVTGRITYKGEPLEKAYLYAFSKVDGLFRGPADVLQPVAKGTFSVELPPGTWYLLARKRARGGAYGPIEMGDKLNFYQGNPLEIAEGETVAIEMPMAERLAWLEEEPGNRGILVRVMQKDGKTPLEGYHVLAYQNADRSGPPMLVSERTNAKGETYILPPSSGVYLRARKNLGGPLDEGENYADADLGPENLKDSQPLLMTAK